ncbi:hypothetical protein A9995_15480 [Erythrobacter sp. QSSC1-22B]|nr:hypothetical protein A9995_15480 [Erythrobacter sp. QSSC1-22B]
MLRAQNYAIFRVRYGPKEELIGIERIDEIGIQDNLAMSDYLLCPKEEAARVLLALEKANA